MGQIKFVLQTTDILDPETGEPTGETTTEYVETYIKDEDDLAKDAIHAQRVMDKIEEKKAEILEKQALFAEQVTEVTPESQTFAAKLESEKVEKEDKLAEWNTKKKQIIAEREAKKAEREAKEKEGQIVTGTKEG